MEIWHRSRNWLAQQGGRTTLILVVVAIYVLVFVLLYPHLGSGVATLAVLPVVLAGWLLGARAGLLTGLLSFVLNTLLLNLAGVVGWDAVLRERGGPGAAAILLIGVTVGWLGTMVERSRSHARELVRERAALQSQIEQQEQTEAALRRRDAILEAVSFASARFLEAADWQRPILEILARFGLAAEVSWVYLFKNHLAPAGVFHTSLRYEWVALGVAPQIDNPELQAFGFRTGGFGRWEALLGRGEVLHGHIRTFPDAERALLRVAQYPLDRGRAGVRWPGLVGASWVRPVRSRA